MKRRRRRRKNMYLLNGKALEANLRFYLEKAASEQETF